MSNFSTPEPPKKKGFFKQYGKWLAPLGILLLLGSSWDYFANNWQYLLNEWQKGYESVDAEIRDTLALDEFPSIPPILANQANAPNSLKVVTWNLYNMGVSKSNKEIEFVAKLLQHYDVLAIQEVSTKVSGPRAIVQLKDELSRKGHSWDYIVSDPTTGEGAERYAFLWKTDRVKLSGRAWLAKPLEDEINREPFMARFAAGDKSILIANFHAVPSSKNPGKEVELLDQLDRSYNKDNLVVLGDFNLAEKSEYFNNLKNRGFSPVLRGQKTSLKRSCPAGKDEYLAQEYDNIFYEVEDLSSSKSGIIDFVKTCQNLDRVRDISDHLPVWAELKWK